MTLEALDGHPLAATRFPAQGEPWGTCVIAGAMGVRQDFYAPFARFLAESGVHALTFDYRGHGFSRDRPLRAVEADVSDWAEKDFDAMLAQASRAAPALPLFAAGHSLGGQLIGVLASGDRIRAALTVATGSGYYRLNERIPLQVRAFWFVLVPLLTPVFGGFPGKRLRVVGDLPRGVAWQWRRWCLHPDYLLSEGERYRSRYARFAAPIVSYSFEDDPIITKRGVDALHARYAQAPVERRHVAPSPERARIGHFGFFHEASRATFWAEALAFWRAAAARAAP